MRIVLTIIGVLALSPGGVQAELSGTHTRAQASRSRRVDGEQYIAVAAGGNIQMTYPYGDTIAISRETQICSRSTPVTKSFSQKERSLVCAASMYVQLIDG
jgi:hypothetical protein